MPDFAVGVKKPIRPATFVVAATDSNDVSKADYRAGDIASALAALPSTGGKIILLDGTYTLGAQLSRAINYVTIEGMGHSTLLNLDAGTAVVTMGAQVGWTLANFRTDAGGVTTATSTDYTVFNINENGVIRNDFTATMEVGDDVDIILGNGNDALIRWSTGDADNHTLVVGLGDSNQAIHFTDKAAIATDWNIAADTHPTGYWHSNTTPATDYVYIGRHDGTTAHIGVGGGTLTMDSTWADLGSVTTVDINGGTVDGVTIGGEAAGAITGTTVDATTDFTIGGTVITDGVITDTGVFVVNATNAVALGSGEAGTTAATGDTLRAPDITTGGAGNVAGADLTFAAGLGTGTGDVGTLIFQLPIVAAAGDNLQTLATRLTFDMVASSSTMTATLAQAISWSVPDDTASVFGIANSAVTYYRVDTRNTLSTAAAHAFDTEDATIASAAGASYRLIDLNSYTLTFTGTTQVTSTLVTTLNLVESVIAGDTATLTVNRAYTARFQPAQEGSNVLLTETAAIGIVNADGSPTYQTGIFVEALTSGTTANHYLRLGGTTAASENSVFLVSTTAVVINDGSGDVDFRVETNNVGNALLIDADNDTVSFFGVSAVDETVRILPNYTLRGTGTTQFGVSISPRFPAAATVQANALYIQARSTASAYTVADMSAIYVEAGQLGAGSTITRNYGIYIADQTAGSSDYGIYIAGADTAAIWVNSADPIRVGATGAGTGQVAWGGTTSGVVTMTVAAAAGTWTMTLPTAVGTAGFQLTDAAGDGVTSWASAASLREAKTGIIPFGSPRDALDRILGTEVYRFRYRQGHGTGDLDTEYVGVMADEAPWAMHYKGGIVNPVNTLGYMVLGFQAMDTRFESLEDKVARLEAEKAALETLVRDLEARI